MSRDDELNEASRPYIEKPDELPAREGGLCFLNSARLCGPDCTAYVDHEAPTPAERCLVLGSLIDVSTLVRERIGAAAAAAAAPVPSYPIPDPRGPK